MKLAYSILIAFMCMLSTSNVFSQQKLFIDSLQYVVVDSSKIYGTLTIPLTKKIGPVMLIIAGSGPTDRDCNQPTGKTNAYKQMAEALALKGIATLRYDKRGIGKSAISMGEGTLRFDHYIDDAVLWIKKLKADKRFNKVIVCGHSEGSLIGMVAAQKEAASAYISIAGASQSIDQILKKQLAIAIMDSEYYSKACLYLDTLKSGKLLTNPDPLLNSLFRPAIQPYMINWMKYNPSEEIKKLKMPVCILQGKHDVQVFEENATELFAAKPTASFRIIDSMNHVLKIADAERQKNLLTYTDPSLKVVPTLIDEIVKFIKP